MIEGKTTLDYSFLLPNQELEIFLEKTFPGSSFSVLSFRTKDLYIEWILFLGKFNEQRFLRVKKYRSVFEFEHQVLIVEEIGSFSTMRKSSLTFYSGRYSFRDIQLWRQTSMGNNWIFFDCPQVPVFRKEEEKNLFFLDGVLLISKVPEHSHEEGSIYLLTC